MAKYFIHPKKIIDKGVLKGNFVEYRYSMIFVFFIYWVLLIFIYGDVYNTHLSKSIADVFESYFSILSIPSACIEIAKGELDERSIEILTRVWAIAHFAVYLMAFPFLFGRHRKAAYIYYLRIIKKYKKSIKTMNDNEIVFAVRNGIRELSIKVIFYFVVSGIFIFILFDRTSGVCVSDIDGSNFEFVPYYISSSIIIYHFYFIFLFLYITIIVNINFYFDKYHKNIDYDSIIEL